FGVFLSGDKLSFALVNKGADDVCLIAAVYGFFNKIINSFVATINFRNFDLDMHYLRFSRFFSVFLAIY
ncbi:MAG: hypothetical protein IIY38_03915, partial [Clostridia bacterium]|nr:hypothetical protein [Clostridia bacterium]